MLVNKIYTLPWHPTKKWGHRNLEIIDKVIIHQSLGTGNLENINMYHITPSSNNHLSKSGAPHIAYHFGIERSGELIQLNEITDITWHTKNQNITGIGVVLVGNFSGDIYKGTQEPTENQIKSLDLLLSFLLGIVPKLNNKNVFGHEDFGKPACPGYIISEYIKNFRSM